MFGTWRVDPETEKLENLRRAYDPITARSSQHQACDRCHEKKLKCSGERDGCDRCAASSHKCEYTRSGAHSSRKAKRSSKHPTDGPSGGRETSGSPGGRDSWHRGRPSKSKSGHGSSHRTHAPAAAASSPADAYGMDTLCPGVYDSSALSYFDNLQHDAAGAAQYGWTTGDVAMHTTTTGVNPALLTKTNQTYAASGDYQSRSREDYAGFQSVDPRYWPQ
ncbi:Uncharacterized protein TCAP_06233 [Tolypocladium capitatum]|uniref:Zn(2)-C6 fungal-type domain-containing protein n=1 Tax=Tolypocladium capitatum TaxID=45235 RepID=A0A2K3Q8D3_9HYPO|nr:Uncharacterized protein TCAP_06233 [Tolypocladium capitatum]